MSDGAGDSMEQVCERLKQLAAESERRARQWEADRATHTTRLRVNKRTHRIRFENESESEVDVVIEPHKPHNGQG
jgi:hypothetical protein